MSKWLRFTHVYPIHSCCLRAQQGISITGRPLKSDANRPTIWFFTGILEWFLGSSWTSDWNVGLQKPSRSYHDIKIFNGYQWIIEGPNGFCSWSSDPCGLCSGSHHLVAARQRPPMSPRELPTVQPLGKKWWLLWPAKVGISHDLTRDWDFTRVGHLQKRDLSKQTWELTTKANRDALGNVDQGIVHPLSSGAWNGSIFHWSQRETSVSTQNL